MNRTPFELGSLLERVIDHRGRTPKKLGSDWSDSGVQVVSAKLISDGRLNLDRHGRFIDHATFSKWMPIKLRRGDVLLTSEAPLGEAALVETDEPLCLGQRVFALRARPEIADSRYLYYYFRGPEGRSALQKRATGTTVSGIRQSELLKVIVGLPPIAAQRRISDVLGSIDDLIECNRRRIEILGETARTLYREWFVQFRFPGYEASEFVHSPLGPIPSGWTWQTLGDLGTWLSGGTPSTKVSSYWSGDIPWITSGSLISFLLDRSERRLTSEGVAAGSRLVERDTVLFVVRGMSLATEFRHGIADVPLAFGQDCKALVAHPDADPLFLAFAVDSLSARIHGMVEYAAHGTGKLSTDRLKALAVATPVSDVQTAFANAVRPVRELMSLLLQEQHRLHHAREMLLSRLVTGQLDVDSLGVDGVFGWAVAPSRHRNRASLLHR